MHVGARARSTEIVFTTLFPQNTWEGTSEKYPGIHNRLSGLLPASFQVSWKVGIESGLLPGEGCSPSPWIPARVL
jgi:hypothetical protein